MDSSTANATGATSSSSQQDRSVTYETSDGEIFVHLSGVPWAHIRFFGCGTLCVGGFLSLDSSKKNLSLKLFALGSDRLCPMLFAGPVLRPCE